MHTPPDFDPCDGLCTHNQRHHVIAQAMVVPENSVQVRAQAPFAMATKHPELQFVCKGNPLFGCTLLLILIPGRLVHAQSTSHAIA